MWIALQNVHLINQTRTNTLNSPNTRRNGWVNSDENLRRNLSYPRSNCETCISSVSTSSEGFGNFIANMTGRKLNMICVPNSEIQVTNLDSFVVKYLKMIPWDKPPCVIAIGHLIENQADVSVY